MIDRNGLFLSSKEIDLQIENLLKKYDEVINDWIALLQGLLVHPHNRITSESISQSTITKSVEEYDLSYKWRNISLTEIEILLIIIQYRPSRTLKTLVYSALRFNDERYLDRNLSLQKYLDTKVSLLLYLVASNITKDSFFGRMVEFCNRISKEVRDDINPIKGKTIFSVPFWKPLPRKKVHKYTGWARHQKDHGSKRPDNYSSTNHLEDSQFMKDEFIRCQEKLDSLHDTLSLLQGFIT